LSHTYRKVIIENDVVSRYLITKPLGSRGTDWLGATSLSLHLCPHAMRTVSIFGHMSEQMPQRKSNCLEVIGLIIVIIRIAQLNVAR
jgi:hypothetical protein